MVGFGIDMILCPYYSVHHGYPGHCRFIENDAESINENRVVHAVPSDSFN